MFRYLLKRILIFLPTLVVISLLAFGLSRMAPGDPVELLLRGGDGPGGRDLLDAERVYRETSELLGLNKPAFYASLSSLAYPDTLHHIPNKDHRAVLRRLIARHGNWPLIAAYYRGLSALEHRLSRLPDTLAPEPVNGLRGAVRQLYLQDHPLAIASLLPRMDSLARRSPDLEARIAPDVERLRAAYDEVLDRPDRWRLYVPDLKWYGPDNQYHHWFTGLLRGDLGTSYIDGRPVAYKLRDAIRWTLLMNGLAILLAFTLSVPLGVYGAVHRGSRFDRLTTLGLFVLYSLPTFWIATLLVVFLTTPEYGLDWFPTKGIGATDPDLPFVERLIDRAYHLVLPVFCLTYGSLAFITRQMRGAMLDAFRQDYIRTARAKGLPPERVVWRHAFRNALFPIITLFGSVFPAVLAGSVVIEVIFNIPGMGLLTVEAINQSNWPVVYAVLMLGAVLTMAGILVADIGYALADPRVTYGGKDKT